MSILSPGRFLSAYNLQSMAYQLPEFGIFALAMMVTIVSGGINLSITYTASLATIIGGLVMSSMSASGISPAFSILSGVSVLLIASVAAGMLNGFVIAWIGVTPMLVTLGSMTLFEGISLNITKGGAISGFPEAFLFFGNEAVLGIPIPMLIFIIVIALTYYVLEKSAFGLSVYMTGCNPKATRFSGINVTRVLFLVYTYSGLLCGIAGLIMASRYNSAKESYGSSYLLQSVSAAVLGGTDISGGFGKVIGTIIAVFIIQTISSGLNILGLNRYLTNVIMGAILIIVLTINFFSSSLQYRTEKKRSM
jgi:ribose/xylose/arabinose/galactoside ABC-type transport system permease subunit